MLAVTLEQPIRTLVAGPIATVAPLATLLEAATVLSDEVVGALLVGHPEKIVGIISERDIVRAVSNGADLEQDRVRDEMTDRVATVAADSSIRAAAALMLSEEIRHLVVLDRGVAIGMVSMRDVLAAAMALTRTR